MDDKFTEYLAGLDIKKEDKNYLSSFFRKKEYIDNLNKTTIRMTGNNNIVNSSMGNYN